MIVETSWKIRNILVPGWTIVLLLAGVTAAAGQDARERRAERGPGLDPGLPSKGAD